METRFNYGLLFHFHYLFVNKTVQVNRPTSLTQKSSKNSDADALMQHETCISACFDYYTHHSGGGNRPEPGWAYILTGWARPGPKLCNEKRAGPKSQLSTLSTIL